MPQVARVDPNITIEESMKNLVTLKEEGHFSVSCPFEPPSDLRLARTDNSPHMMILAANRSFRDPPFCPSQSTRRPPYRSRRDRAFHLCARA